MIKGSLQIKILYRGVFAEKFQSIFLPNFDFGGIF